jgi:hypothetical protein
MSPVRYPHVYGWNLGAGGCVTMRIKLAGAFVIADGASGGEDVSRTAAAGILKALRAAGIEVVRLERSSRFTLSGLHRLAYFMGA